MMQRQRLPEISRPEEESYHEQGYLSTEHKKQPRLVRSELWTRLMPPSDLEGAHGNKVAGGACGELVTK